MMSFTHLNPSTFCMKKLMTALRGAEAPPVSFIEASQKPGTKICVRRFVVNCDEAMSTRGQIIE
jgi:hypothetical protein